MTVTSARIEYQLKEARHQVSDLDRAPRSNSESWHQLRQNLALAQSVLSRFERANRNYEKFQTHILYRLSAVLLGKGCTYKKYCRKSFIVSTAFFSYCQP